MGVLLHVLCIIQNPLYFFVKALQRSHCNDPPLCCCKPVHIRLLDTGMYCIQVIIQLHYQSILLLSRGKGWTRHVEHTEWFTSVWSHPNLDSTRNRFLLTVMYSFVKQLDNMFALAYTCLSTGSFDSMSELFCREPIDLWSWISVSRSILPVYCRVPARLGLQQTTLAPGSNETRARDPLVR